MALKLVSKSALKNKKATDRIHAEMTNMETLSGHKNIITLHECFETKEYFGIAMEHAPHGELFDYVQKQEGMKEEAAKEMFRGIVKGVQHCHSNGITHRDLKLENILLSKDNTPKVRNAQSIHSGLIATKGIHTLSQRLSHSESCFNRCVSFIHFRLLILDSQSRSPPIPFMPAVWAAFFTPLLRLFREDRIRAQNAMFGVWASSSTPCSQQQCPLTTAIWDSSWSRSRMVITQLPSESQMVSIKLH